MILVRFYEADADSVLRANKHVRSIIVTLDPIFDTRKGTPMVWYLIEP